MDEYTLNYTTSNDVEVVEKINYNTNDVTIARKTTRERRKKK